MKKPLYIIGFMVFALIGLTSISCGNQKAYPTFEWISFGVKTRENDLVYKVKYYTINETINNEKSKEFIRLGYYAEAYFYNDLNFYGFHLHLNKGYAALFGNENEAGSLSITFPFAFKKATLYGAKFKGELANGIVNVNDSIITLTDELEEGEKDISFGEFSKHSVNVTPSNTLKIFLNENTLGRFYLSYISLEF